ncbi:zinc finger protein 260-like isoform X2 [Pectinophora gossypiella]|uniref:zinc finger protein 260-like isoform X2 n=1 Tax=Pectinophora gossypiella TaxID=13191 RepID=UPI00214EF54F|nr:zinc finger protein 260-like isoform X2 [Pectinophora gossypiella]
MTAAAWKPEKDICRCCHAEGSYHNLSEPRFVLGQTEVYSDMLKSCFNVELSTVSGMLSAPTFTICEPCILRLRDASNFKKQVLRCEERFKDMFKNIIQALRPEFDVKQEVRDDNPEVKVEFVHMDDEDDAVDMKFDDSDDDQPVIQIKVEQHSKKKGKTKVKSKPKSKKPVKNQELNEVAAIEMGNSIADEPDMGEDGEDESSKPKKGKPDYFTIIEEAYHCKLCPKAFSSQPLISQHYRFVHLKRRPRERKCQKCDMKIPGYLKAYHMEEKHGIPAPFCGVCQKKFRYPCNVLQHQKKVHMGEKTVSCKVCGKEFFNGFGLRLHMSSHSDVKRFKCVTCGREFRWENNLKDHMKIHAGDRRHVCKACGKAFVQKSTLKTHVFRNHPGMDVS